MLVQLDLDPLIPMVVYEYYVTAQGRPYVHKTLLLQLQDSCRY